jgi:hypothetical protein
LRIVRLFHQWEYYLAEKRQALGYLCHTDNIHTVLERADVQHRDVGKVRFVAAEYLGYLGGNRALCQAKFGVALPNIDRQ